MFASIKLLTLKKPTQKGHPVVVELYHSDKKRPRKTIGHALPHFWNEDTAEPRKEHPDYYDLLPVVKTYAARCTKINHGEYKFDQAKEIIFGSGAKPKKQKAMFLAFFDTIADEKKKKGLPHKTFTEVKRIVADFTGGDDIPINKVTYEWLNQFLLYKLESGKCKEGGAMSYLRTMRSVYKEAQRRSSLKVKKDNPFLGIIKDPTPRPVINITPADLEKLKSFTPKKSTTPANREKMLRNIDVWLFQFYIGGHDYVDAALLKWENIKNGRVVFQRHKLRNKKMGGQVIDNLLIPEALAILEKHGDKNSDRIFSFIPCPVNEPSKYNGFIRAVNRSLEAISKTLGIPHLKTKSPRYVFRTFAGEKLIHDILVARLMGHKLDGITYRYQGHISKEVQDQAHKNIIAC